MITRRQSFPQSMANPRETLTLVSAVVGVAIAPSQAIAAPNFALNFDNPNFNHPNFDNSNFDNPNFDNPNLATVDPGPSSRDRSTLLPVPAVPSFVPLVATAEASRPLPPPPPLHLSRPALPTSATAGSLPSGPLQPEPPASPNRTSLADTTVGPDARPDAGPDAGPELDPALPVPTSPTLDDLFVGGPDSLVAKAIGAAEGTRTSSGGYTAAYFGHVDPGNQAWNLGSFSYQHGANSPEEADAKQLQRLQGQAQTLRTQAQQRSLTLDLSQTLNGLDLINQAPATALGRGGYLDRLVQAHELGLRGDEAVLWARTRAFLHPDTQRWNAPGLGNNIHQITQDQSRRQQAIQQAIATAQLAPDLEIVAIQPPPNPQQPDPNGIAPALDDNEMAIQDALADDLISLDLPPL